MTASLGRQARLAVGLDRRWAASAASTRGIWPAASPRRGWWPSPIRWERWRRRSRAEFDVPRHYTDPLALIDDPAVERVVIVSPTAHPPRAGDRGAAGGGKPTFCEKPPALSLAEVAAMQEAIARSGMFFQMGFMRRFDAGYAAAKKQIDAGRIGTPLVFKSTSRDPFRPSLEYADPKSSGGMLIDMGIHDFDLARWFMGEVATVSTIGATIAYPELATVGDIDNAIASLTFTSGKLGVVDLSRSGIYGYDIATEILGLGGHDARSATCARRR